MEWYYGVPQRVMDFIQMRFCLLWMVCFCFSFSRSSNMIEHARKRRDATQFYGILQCHQPDVIVLARFGDYGCSCGRGCYTGKPLDDTDRCCQIHDSCYKAQDDSDTQTRLDWAWKGACGHLCVSYSYSCKNETITCAADNNTPLGQALCECDKNASKCLAKAQHTYDKRLSNVDPSIWCSKTSNVTELLFRMKEPLAGNETTIVTEISPPMEEVLTGQPPASSRPIGSYSAERRIYTTTAETKISITDKSSSSTSTAPSSSNTTNVKNAKITDDELLRGGARSVKFELHLLSLIFVGFRCIFSFY